MQKKPCLFFQKNGNCKYGEGCNFEHVPGSPGMMKDNYKKAICKNFAATGSCKMGDTCKFKHANPNETPNVCNNFMKFGDCKFGDKCHFLHSNSGPSGNYGGYGGGNNSKTSLCKNFMQGDCKYGEKCKFLHNDQDNSEDRFGFFKKGKFEKGYSGPPEGSDEGPRGSGGFVSSGRGMPTGICFYFKDHGTCKFGENCKYSHDF